MKFVLINLIILSSSFLYSQTNGGPGLSFGSETWLSLPSINLYHTYNQDKIELTVSGSASTFLIAYFNYAAVIGHEIKYKKFTFDTSLGFSHFPEIENENEIDPIGPYKQITFTPKIGYFHKGFRIKLGIVTRLYTRFDDGPAAYIGYFSKGIPWTIDFSYNKFGNF